MGAFCTTHDESRPLQQRAASRHEPPFTATHVADTQITPMTAFTKHFCILMGFFLLLLLFFPSSSIVFQFAHQKVKPAKPPNSTTHSVQQSILSHCSKMPLWSVCQSMIRRIELIPIKNRKKTNSREMLLGPVSTPPKKTHKRLIPNKLPNINKSPKFVVFFFAFFSFADTFHSSNPPKPKGKLFFAQKYCVGFESSEYFRRLNVENLNLRERKRCDNSKTYVRLVRRPHAEWLLPRNILVLVPSTSVCSSNRSAAIPPARLSTAQSSCCSDALWHATAHETCWTTRSYSVQYDYIELGIASSRTWSTREKERKLCRGRIRISRSHNERMTCSWEGELRSLLTQRKY